MDITAVVFLAAARNVVYRNTHWIIGVFAFQLGGEFGVKVPELLSCFRKDSYRVGVFCGRNRLKHEIITGLTAFDYLLAA